MKRKFTKALAIFAAFCVAFTSLPMLTGGLNASAASYWSNVSGKANGQTSVTLSWKQLSKKQRKKISGITVFRNGAAAANLSKTAKGFTDAGLKAGTSYTYQVKTYKKVTKKTKMWLNKKTGQWQKKKPAKKYRGKKKTFKKVSYKYSNASKTVTVRTSGTTAGKPASGSFAGTDAQFVNTTKDLTDRTYNLASLPSSVEYGNGTVVFEVFSEGTVTWTSSNTAVATVTSKFSGSECCMTIKGVGKTTITAKSSRGPSKSFVVTVVSSSGTNPGTNPGGGGGTDPTPTYEYKTVTDYLGVTRNIRKRSDQTYWYTEDGIQCTPMAKFDRTQNGSFEISGGTILFQQNGVTFNKTLLDDPIYKESDMVSPYVEMYNGDFNKLTFNVTPQPVNIATHDKEMNEITIPFVMKNGKRLAMFKDVRTQTGPLSSSNANKKVQVKQIRFDTYDTGLHGLGFVSGNIDIDVYYDGTLLAEWAIPVNTNANDKGLSPLRQTCLYLAEEAFEVKGKTGDYDTDMHAIEDYIYEKYVYDQSYDPYGYGTNGKILLSCVGGALVLETYSIYEHQVYGFDSWGQYRTQENAESCNAALHAAFSLDTEPTRYFETNGHIQKP